MDHIRGFRINHKLLWKAFAITLALGVIICAMVNFIISHEFSWSLYVAGSSLLALGIVTALIFGGKHRLLLSTIVVGILIMPFLMLVERLSSAGEWAWSIGFPIAAVSLTVMFLCIGLFRYTRINNWYCSSITEFATLPISLVADSVVAQRSHSSVPIFNTITDVLGTVVVSSVLLYIGIKRRQIQKVGS